VDMVEEVKANAAAGAVGAGKSGEGIAG